MYNILKNNRESYNYDSFEENLVCAKKVNFILFYIYNDFQYLVICIGSTWYWLHAVPENQRNQYKIRFYLFISESTFHSKC